MCFDFLELNTENKIWLLCASHSIVFAFFKEIKNHFAMNDLTGVLISKMDEKLLQETHRLNCNVVYSSSGFDIQTLNGTLL